MQTKCDFKYIKEKEISKSFQYFLTTKDMRMYINISYYKYNFWEQNDEVY